MRSPRTAHTLPAILAVLAVLAAIPASAAAPEPRNITSQFTSLGLNVQNLQAFEVGGIVVLRGKTSVRSAAFTLGEHARSLGYTRVANLIQIAEVPDDSEIRRDAERELAIHESLAGARISVQAENGVVFLRGQVRHEMQKDMAVAVLRSVDGIREIRSQLVDE